MAPPLKKRRVATNGTNGINGEDHPKVFPNPPLAAATLQDKQRWQGFCEIESEPAFFNVMLRDWGVRGVKVQEVFGLDEDLLAMLPRPIYGLIFLFRYALEENKQEASCPDHVWFANQTHEFACATVSLLNIVNNIPDIELGQQLRAFKDFSQPLTPAQRGDAIGNFEFVKQIHNSFARKMDMLNIDLGMENAYDDKKSKKKAAPAKAKKGKVVTEDDWQDDENAFHFLAYVPIENEVWQLDGLDRQPSKVGKFKRDDWMSVAIPRIEERMMALSTGGIEFVLLSLVKDPLIAHQGELSSNVKSLQEVQARLSAVNPGWKDFATDGSNEEQSKESDVVLDASERLGISENDIRQAEIPPSIAEQLQAECPAKLMGLRQELVTSQAGLRRMVMDEQSQAQDDRRRATERRHEYGPLIHKWLSMLAEKEGAVKDLLEDIR